MKARIDAIKEYSKKEYGKMTRKPSGMLRYPYIVPGSQSYQDSLWDWDSWLTNVAVRQIMMDFQEDPQEFAEYERGCIFNFLDHTPENGRVPILITEKDGTKFFEGYQNVHKPCLAQHAAFLVKIEDGDANWLKDSIFQLCKFIDYYMEHCKHEETGLYFWLDDCAIGVDNDPCTYFRPEKSSASIFLNCLMYKELKAIVYILDCLKLKTEKYKNAAEELREAVHKHLWDERDGFFYSADINLVPVSTVNEGLHSGAPRHWNSLIQRLDVWSGFMAMWSGIATKEQAERIVNENLLDKNRFWADYGVCSLSKLEKMYKIEKTSNPSCWLGPVWGIVNYMCFRGLLNFGFQKEAAELAEKTILLFGEDILQCGEMHEYYDPDCGIGINNQGFQSWNLLVNNMIAWYEKRPVVEEF